MDSVLTSFRTSPYGRTACVQNTRRAARFTLVFCRPSVRINVHTLCQAAPEPIVHLSISNIQKLTSPPGGMDSVLTSFRTSPYGRTACVQNTRRAARFTLVFCRPSVRINVHTLCQAAPEPIVHLSISNIQKLTSPPGGMDSVLTSFRTSPYGRTACVQNTRRAARFTLVFCRPSVPINVHTLSRRAP
jgi:hypothetical protein